MEKSNENKQYFGVYAFVRKDFMHPPLPNISRTLKATKYDASVLIKYGDKIKF